MSQGNSHDIKVLKGLATGLSESADGYNDAALEIGDERYAHWFRERSAERRHMAETLRAEVIQRGGTQEEDASILAKAQRAFSDIKQALLRNDASVIDTVEGYEQGLKARFQSALEDQDISATTRETIRRAQDQILSIQDQLGALKRSLDSQRDADNPLYPQ